MLVNWSHRLTDLLVEPIVHVAARITASSVAVVLLSFSSFEPLFLCISFTAFVVSLSLPSTKQSDEPTNDYCSSARNERTRRKNGTERERNNVDDVERVFKLSAPSSSSVMPTFNAPSFLLLLQGCQMAKFDLDCAPMPSILAQSKERKGSHFAAAA